VTALLTLLDVGRALLLAGLTPTTLLRSVRGRRTPALLGLALRRPVGGRTLLAGTARCLVGSTGRHREVSPEVGSPARFRVDLPRRIVSTT
jgi:hypothetical protein